MSKNNYVYVILPCIWLLLVGCEPAVESPTQQAETSESASAHPVVVEKSVDQNAPVPSNLKFVNWQKATPQMRDRMAEKFVSDGSLLGKVEDEVEAQLGKPDFRSERFIYSFEFGEKLEGSSAPSLILNLNCEGLVETAGQATFPRQMTPESFDEKKWKVGTDQQRFYMAPSLAKSKRMIGMSRESAVELLGEPTKRTLPQIAYYSRPRIAGATAPADPNRKLIIKFNELYQVDKVIYTQK